MDIAERVAAMTSDLPQPITVGELHRFAPDAQDRRRLSFTVAAGDRSLAEVAVIPNASGAPQEHIDAFAQALVSLLRGSEGRVEDAEARVAGHRATIARQREEIDALKAKLADFESGRSVRGEFYAIEGNGGVWLQGRPSGAAYGLWFKSWADLARERPGLRPCGTRKSAGYEPEETYVVMRPVADLEPAP
jgi:hypothetical protein